MSKIGPRFTYLEQPIFCLCVIKDYVLVASGGGGKKFGVRNKIVSYRIIDDCKFSDAIHFAEFEKEIPVFISSYEPLNLFCTCIDNMTVFYTLNISSGVFSETIRLKVMDFFDGDVYQSVCRLDNKGKYLASGTTDGILKLWELASSGSINPSLIKETQAHFKSINDILFIDGKNLVITAGADGCCKIFEATSLKLLKKLSFRVSLNDKFNYSMRGMRFDKYSGYLYTIEAPLRGHTFLTKWDTRNNFNPLSTIKVSDSICTAIDYNPLYDLIGLADCNGSISYVDPTGEMSKIKEIALSEITIKSVAFKNGNLITGAADNALQMNYICKRNIVSINGLFKIVLLILFAYYFYSKYVQK